MIKLFEIVDKIDEVLRENVKDAKILDYSIKINANYSISVMIRAEKIEETLYEYLSRYDCVDAEFINSDEFEQDKEYYHNVFAKEDKINDNSSRRHLANLFSDVPKIANDIPVVTFYSYKGGVGRSTTLASFASYLSMHHGKKVVILDCDFEAPGFTNFYVDDYNSPIYNEGLIEYFLDSQIDDVNIGNYYWEVSKRFSGKGEIYVFPCGNLDNNNVINSRYTTHLSHYLNGLSRIDTLSQDTLTNQFEILFKEISTTLTPDVILIDSRTGFNDIFGISAFRLSDIVVGFFSNTIQTHPGIDFFLETLKKKNAPQLVAVNSIISSTGKKWAFKEFNEYINTHLYDISINENNESDNGRGIYSIITKYISENTTLKNIGSPIEDPQDFIDLIKDQTFLDYKELFESIFSLIEYKVHKDTAVKYKNASTEIAKIVAETTFDVKKRLLNSLYENMPKLYAEHIENFEDEFKANRYFFRECMTDLFNPSKILIIGNKGTGKTYIYNSLKNDNIVNELRKKANKEFIDCKFVHMIDNDKRLYTEKLDDKISGTEDSFFNKFWTVYIWDSLMLEKPYGYISRLDTFPLDDSTRANVEIVNRINDAAMLIKMEDDLKALDDYLSAKNQKVIIIFDDLDNVVKPHKWSERISVLINLCRRMRFTSIHPKLFIRSDLFEKITNLTNKNELYNRSISIEWTSEELFAYFFKQVFSHSKEDFFRLMRDYNIFPSKYITTVKRRLEESGDQPPIDDYVLRHLCAVFFGRYADIDNSPRYGESYDWFYRNLKNANDTLSLRPFIDLINESLTNARRQDQTDAPILPQKYYLQGSTRAKAVENHFKDLAKEKGNEDLNPIFAYIKDRAAKKFKKETLSQSEMFSLLDDILRTGQLKECKDRDSIISLLKINGIMRDIIVRRNNEVYKKYQFALLYKYYLGLKSKSSMYGL